MDSLLLVNKIIVKNMLIEYVNKIKFIPVFSNLKILKTSFFFSLRPTNTYPISQLII